MNTDPYIEIQKHYQQRDRAAKEWKEKGGKVAGYFCNSVPEELILAAGLFPLRLSGDPRGGTEEADEYAEPAYEGFVAFPRSRSEISCRSIDRRTVFS